jgi:hypothetical protein
MSEKKTLDSYEVGYGKPPKDTQLKKGSSGNPKGRPKRALDFHHELLRESRASVIINENGRRRCIPKYSAVIKQTGNQSDEWKHACSSDLSRSLPSSIRESRSAGGITIQ